MRFICVVGDFMFYKAEVDVVDGDMGKKPFLDNINNLSNRVRLLQLRSLRDFSNKFDISINAEAEAATLPLEQSFDRRGVGFFLFT